MKKRRSSSTRASALQSALSTALISMSAILVAIAAPTNAPNVFGGNSPRFQSDGSGPTRADYPGVTPTSTPPCEPGALDPSFDGDGKVTTDVLSGNDGARSVAIQPDGKIVAAGWSDNGSDRDFALVRYNIDGSLDTTFGGTGKVTTGFLSSSFDDAYSVAVQPDGKIVAAGSSDDDFALVRYNANGSLDTSFGGTGKVTTAVLSSEDLAYSVAIQTDGKIVAAGLTWNGSNYVFALVRYNANGSLDTTFGGTGKVTTAVLSGNDYAYSVAIQPDGKIIAAGRSFNGSNYVFALVRYNTNGSLDTTFGGTGKVTTAVLSGNGYAYSVAIQPDGKIIAAGRSFNGSNDDFALVRYNTDGSLDTTFGGTGKVTTAVLSGSDVAHSVAIQADGKIVLAGYSWNGSDYDFALVRYNTDGSLDTTFGDTGKVTTAVLSSTDNAYSVAIQPDGKIIAAGSSLNGSNFDFALVRYYGVPCAAPTPTSVVSRKTHGVAGTFDVDLPLTGTPGIECRSGGTTNDYQMIVTFANSVVISGNPQGQVTAGTGTVGSGGVSNGGAVTISGNVVMVPLTNIANAQTINVTLFGVNGGGNVVIPMSVLVGDTNANAAVNSGDVSQTKAWIGQTLDATNFRSDVNANGAINAGDVSIIKSNIGTGLP